MSINLLVVLSLIAAASCSPAPLPQSGGNNTAVAATTTTVDGDNCGQVCADALKGIPGVDQIIITALINIKITGFVNVITLIVKLTIALGNIIDVLISGLGSIFIRVVAFIIKVCYCVKGWGGDQSICTKEWNAQFGCIGDYSTIDELKGCYRVTQCKKDVEILVAIWIKANGLPTGMIKVLIQLMTNLCLIVEVGVYTRDVFITASVYIFSIFGCLVDSYKSGTGVIVVQEVVSFCSTYYVLQGFASLKLSLIIILANIYAAVLIKFDWSLVKIVVDVVTIEVIKIFKGLLSIVGGSNLLIYITVILNLRPCYSFDDLLSFSVQVILAISVVLDIYIKGLGTLIVKLVGCLIYYIVAVLGVGRNSLLFVATKAYLAIFGVTVSVTVWAEIAAAFNCVNPKAELDAIVNVYTNNKGLVSLSGAGLLIIKLAYILVDTCVKGTGILEADLTIMMSVCIRLLCCFANSITANIGKTICDSLLLTANYYLQLNGYIAIGDTAAIYTDIATCNNVPVPW